MSSLWTPSGEHFPKKEGDGAPAPPPGTPPGAPPGRPPGPPAGTDASGAPDGFTEEEAQRRIDLMRAQLADTPAEVVVANHCYGLFELAAIYLSQVPPKLFEARLAIDGLGAMLDGLQGRLGEAEQPLLESLSQLRLAYVSLEGTERSASEETASTEG
jgi:hypothetical protein